MPTPPVVDQEFVVHLFAPLDGPRATEAYRQVQRVWIACREQLGMTQQIAGLPGSALPPPEAAGGPVTDRVLAVQEGQAGIRQAVLRQVHDVLNLSVALAQPAPEAGRSGPPRRELGWADYAAMWARASPPPSQADALLGEAHLYLARMPPGKTGRVAATAELGQALDSLLPYRDDRPQKWWEWGITTTAGYALWDTRLAADTGPLREIVLVAAADQDDELSAWAWSDRSPAMPPFGRYLMHAAKLRYEARLLDTWHSTAPGSQDIDRLVAELNAALEPGKPVPGRAELLGSLRGRLRAEQARLKLLETDLAHLGQTVSVAQRNLAAQPGCGAGDDGPAGLFAADQSLARWLTGQVSSDRDYLQIQLDRIGSVLDYVTEELGQVRGQGAESGPAVTSADPRNSAPDAVRRVFVVYGRDGALATSFFDLLYAVGLEPLEWERLVRPTGTATPYLGDVVRKAPHLARATLVLLSPDDIVELHPDLRQENDHPYERARSAQARPNVLFELGLAFMAYPERTVIVEVGPMRPIADLAGLNVIRFDGSAIAVKKILDRLDLAGCPVDTSGTSWLDPGRFAGLATYRRGPGTSGAAADGET
jgi:CASPASE and TPR Repeat-associated protein/predicted nucleotide-binding protein with TIR-like domain